MSNPKDSATTSQVLSDQRQANEQLVLTNLQALERMEALEERAISGEKRLEQQATQHLADRKELQNANYLATIGRLTASIAHEFGTPLAVIRVRAQMIAAGEVPAAELSADAAVILAETERMTRMVREVLDLARPLAAVTPASALNLAVLGRQVVSMLAPLTRERNTRLVFASDDSPMWVLGDSSRLLQILSNLVINASQSMVKSGVVELRVGRRRACAPNCAEADYVAIDVTDQGAGMSSQILERIFEPFFTTKGDRGGTGLGLAVSSRIANEHGGFIGVVSEVNRGSCFTLYLPPLPAPLPAVHATR